MLHLTLQPDSKLGRFTLVSRLGQSNVAAVYRARGPNGERRALKVMDASNPVHRDRLRAEFQALRHLRHDNVVRVYEWGEDAGCVFYVMELVEGVPFIDAIRAHRSLLASLALFDQVVQTVAFLHDRQIAHRNLGLGNVLVQGTDDGLGEIVLIGFGIHLPPPQSAASSATITPEQATFMLGKGPALPAGEISPREDIYALGSFLYELLTAQGPLARPAGAEKLEDLLNRVRSQVPPPPAQVWSSAPSQLSKLALRMLAKHPDVRPMNGDEAHQAFQIALARDTAGGELPLSLASPLVQKAENAAPREKADTKAEPEQKTAKVETRTAAVDAVSAPQREPSFIARWAAAAAVLGAVCLGVFGIVSKPQPVANQVNVVAEIPSFADPDSEYRVPDSGRLMVEGTQTGIWDAGTAIAQLATGATLITGPIKNQKRPPCTRGNGVIETQYMQACWEIYSVSASDIRNCDGARVFEPEAGYCRKYRRAYMPVLIDEEAPLKPSVVIPEGH
jgi:hypothetical protein